MTLQNCCVLTSLVYKLTKVSSKFLHIATHSRARIYLCQLHCLTFILPYKVLRGDCVCRDCVLSVNNRNVRMLFRFHGVFNPTVIKEKLGDAMDQTGQRSRDLTDVLWS